MPNITLSNYKAVILAGGKGTRLYPVTKEIPKPLLPIRRRPMINFSVDLFMAFGIRDIAVLVSHEFKDEFVWWKKRYYPEERIRIVEEKEPLGTFGGLELLKDWLFPFGDKEKGAPFFLTNGDNIFDLDLAAMGDFHRKKNVLATLALAKVPNPQDFGVVVCDDEEKICKFIEKPKDPPSQYISAGIYLCSPKILDYHFGLRFSMIEKDVFPQLAEIRELGGFPFEGQWNDCGTWERYEEARSEWA